MRLLICSCFFKSLHHNFSLQFHGNMYNVLAHKTIIYLSGSLSGFLPSVSSGNEPEQIHPFHPERNSWMSSVLPLRTLGCGGACAPGLEHVD